MSQPRPEYPRPLLVRPDWLNLNGLWEFEIDPSDSGADRGLRDRPLESRITVPFCPESTLSGIGHVDFMEAVWYRRAVTIPAEWAGREVLLHCGAVDYDATVWVNGREVGRHRGGSTPFVCPLRGVAGPGETAVIVVRARDSRHGPQPRGKQSRSYGNQGCHYTRTTGIWQTVWLEPVGSSYFLRPRVTPLLGEGALLLELPLGGARRALRARAVLRDDRGVVAEAESPAGADFHPTLLLRIPAERQRRWGPGDPFLYELHLELRDGSGTLLDQAESYAALRAVTIEGTRILLNGQPLFQRLVLDQGYYPDGLLTAPSDEALRRDIELSLAAGFNGARLHQKIFEERFLYHADRLGYLVWGELPDWGCTIDAAEDFQKPGVGHVLEWLEALERDYSHPCLVGWCPLNETGQRLLDRYTDLDAATRALFLAAKAADRTRPVLDASGYSHRVPETDVFDTHDYEQDPAAFARKHAGAAHGQPDRCRYWKDPQHECSLPYGGQPFFVSEFGGIWWNPEARPDEPSWGYGSRPRTLEEFHDRFAGLCRHLLENPGMFGYCYTQLTDVFQEQNGIYTFDRRPKFDLARLRAVQGQTAAAEAAPLAKAPAGTAG